MATLYISVVEDGITADGMVGESTAQFYVASYLSSADTFSELRDTPDNKIGAALKLLRVNSTESEIEFHDISAYDIDNVPSGTIQATNVQDAINELDGDQSLLDVRITDAESDIATNTNNIATNTNNIATNTNNIATNTNNIATNTNNIATLNETVILPTTAEVEVVRDQNEEQYAASGYVHFGKSVSAGVIDNVNVGLWARADGQYLQGHQGNKLWLGREDSYKTGVSKTNHPTTHISGVISGVLTTNNDPDIFDGASSTIQFPPAEDGTRTYDSATGTTTKHASAAETFAAETSTNKVVTDRVDMWGIELFLRNVTVDDPFVYPNGCIQSLATEFEGIATVESNRPKTYFAQYDGQDVAIGKGINWFTATDDQKKTIAKNAFKHGYLHYDAESGFVRQWCLRIRTFAGAGNGDWEIIDSALNSTSSAKSLRYNPTSETTVQGALDVPGSEGNTVYRHTLSVLNPHPNNGVFTAQGVAANTASVNGECYFLVGGTVSRLNQGAYHPSFNPMGCKQFFKDTVGTVAPWYDGLLTGLINSTTDCFNEDDGSYPTVVGQVAYNTGYIGTSSGRPDGRFYDAIYAGGQGGVTDYRLSAYDMSSPEEAAKIKAKVENGTYRGEEKFVYTYIAEQLGSTQNINQLFIANTNPKPDVGTDISQVDETTVETARVTSVVANGANWQIYLDRTVNRVVYSNAIIQQFTSGTSVSGEFEQVDVIGDPANILQTPDLANGWLGGWSPDIPTGVSLNKRLSRKAVGVLTSKPIYYTDDNGATWLTGAVLITGVTNTIAGITDLGRIGVLPYTAFAKQTKESTRKRVLNGADGVLPLLVNNFFNSCTLQESLIGKINTNQSDDGDIASSVPMTSIVLDSSVITNDEANWGKLAITALYSEQRHPALNLGSNAVTSSAVKVLAYQIANNGQCTLGYQANELTWDDSSAVIVNGLTEAQNNHPVGTFINIRLSRITGYFIRVGTVGGGIWDAYMNDGFINVGFNGDLYFGDTLICKRVGLYGSWGDDSTVKISNGTSTFTDLNGNVNIQTSHELSIPYGYTHNHARAGSQVEGVDL